MKRKGTTISCVLLAIAMLAIFAWPAWTVYYDGFFTNVLVKGALKVNTTDYVDAPASRNISFPLAAFVTNGAPIAADGTTNPGIATTDNVPAIVWADDEVTPVQITFRVPAEYSSGMAFRLLISTSDDTTKPEVDWQIWANTDAVVFDAAATAQTAVQAAANSSATNEEVTLTPDATGAAQIVAGAWITLDLWNTTTGSGTLELKGVEAYYTAAR